MSGRTLISLGGFCTLLGLSAPAHAYLDPATGSIILQATIGAIAGGTLFLRTSLWRLKTMFAFRGKSQAKTSDGE